MIVRKDIYDAFMTGPEGAIELFHGYTYSGHPRRLRGGDRHAGHLRKKGCSQRAGDLAPYWEEAVHSLRDARHVIDVRNLGLIAGIELEPLPGAADQRALEAFLQCFEDGVMIRTTGDIIALSPPLIIEKPQIDRIFTTIREVLATIE